MYGHGLGVKKDSGQAVSWYRKAAEQGNVDAQLKLASTYYGGDGVKRDYAEAFSWLGKAAEQGNADAQFLLGSMYYEGDGMEPDSAEALKWFRKAAAQGNADATNGRKNLTRRPVSVNVTSAPRRRPTRRTPVCLIARHFD
jgi:TPR repeat protein